MTHHGCALGDHRRQTTRQPAADSTGAATGDDSTGAVVLAAGQGVRLGRGVKSLVPLSGSPILAWTLIAVAANRCVSHIVVTAPARAIDSVRRVAAGLDLQIPVQVVVGGDSRQRSASKGIEALPAHLAWAAVTDAARPLQAPGLIDVLVARLAVGELLTGAGGKAVAAIIPALPLPDTIHHIAADGLLTGTPKREALRAAQTPQVACRACLSAAHREAARAGVTCTDDAAVMRWAGAEVLAVPGDPANIKITTPDDLIIAEAYLAKSRQSTQTPTQGRRQTSRQGIGEIPRQGSGEIPRQASGEIPRQASGEIPRQASGETSRQASGKAPRRDTRKAVSTS